MITEKDIELIEINIFGNSSDDDKNVFEQRMKIDKEFAQEVSFIRDLQVSSKELAKKELKDKLKKISSEYKKGEIKKNTGFRTYLAIAASVVAMVGITAILYLMQSNNRSETLTVDISEVNRLISESANKTQRFKITSIGEGYGYAQSDSMENKLSVLIINSDKYKNLYLYRDTLFLFSPPLSINEIFSISEYHNRIYFIGENDSYYYIELKTENKLNTIEKERDKEMIEKIKTLRKN